MIYTPRRWYDRLLGTSNAKTTKGEPLGYLTGILYLAPAKSSGFNVCARSSAGCEASCLNSAGRGKFTAVQAARLAKTLAYFNNRAAFLDDLRLSIRRIIRLANKQGLRPAVRLNGTSDLPFFNHGIQKEFPEVIFYGYTARIDFLRKSPENLTFSRKEDNQKDVDYVLQHLPEVNVAVVFRKKLPAVWRGREVIDADLHDCRFLDRRGVICGLTAKGKAKRDTSGFVVDVEGGE